MPTWLTSLLSSTLNALKGPLTSLATLLVGKKLGQAEQQAAQSEQDLKDLQAGADAGASAPVDDDSLLNSPDNRDER